MPDSTAPPPTSTAAAPAASAPGSSAVTQERLMQVLKSIQHLKSQGHTEATHPELAVLVGWVQRYSQQRALHNQPARAPAPAEPAGEVPFSEAQLNALKVQILAYRFISKNLPIPDNVRDALFSAMGSVSPAELAAMEDPTSAVGKVVEAARIQALDPASLALEKSYYAPFHLLKQHLTDPRPASVLQRLVIPGLTPPGLDPHALLDERERRIEGRVRQRIEELEALPSNLANGPAEGDAPPQAGHKLRALIELKALRLLEKQKQMRRDILEGMHKTTTLATANDRTAFRRVKKLSKRDARLTEKLERQHRLEREKRERQRHAERLQNILTHAREHTAWHRNAQTRQVRLGRLVLNFHAHVEKEEQKRIERVSKERLDALRANDEVAYRKLLDQAKDSRISHLLSQTDAYLESLSQAVRRQQTEALHSDPTLRGGEELMEETAGGDPSSYAYAGDGLPVDDYYESSHRIKETVDLQPSILVGGTLKDYQLKGLQWMVSLYNNRLNGILADEMGLGKTIQTLSLITFLIERKRQNGPYLVIVPLSTMPNWISEFERWAPSVRTVVYKGAPPARRALQQNALRHGDFQVLLTTFEYIIKDRPVLSRIKWVHMIIDEGHRMKNTKSKLTQTINQYYSTRYRLILTGTPLQNNLPELWALLNFVLPRIFDSVTSFDEWFNTPFASAGGGDRIALTEEEALLVIRRLHKVLRPFLLRRLKKDVESELPDKVENIIRCRQSALQLSLYHQISKHGMLLTGQKEKGKGVRGLSNTIMQLRKLVNHPFVFEEVENLVNPTSTNNDSLYRSAGKFELLDRVLPKLFRTGHRVLMFFQMTQVITIMEDFLQLRGWRHLRLDGSTKHEDRSAMLKMFNAPDSPYLIFLLSTRAGGLGLNLQSADTVIIFDSDWNPHQDLQAQDRAHRIGQTKEVRILRLITEKSVEESILARAQYKLDMDGKVIQAGKFDQKSTAEEREAYLRSLLEVDPAEEAEEEGYDDDDLNEILARSPEELALFKQMDEEREAEEKAAWEARGGTGPPPERLMTEAEVPEIYLQEVDTEADQRELANLERRNRVRNAVHYDDVLSEEQWMDAIEDGDDVEELARKKRESRERRRASQAARETGEGGGGADSAGSGGDDDDDHVRAAAPVTPAPERKRGRPRKHPIPEAATVDGTPATTPRGKPRGRKRADDDTVSLEDGSGGAATPGSASKRGGATSRHPAKRRKTAEADPLPPLVRAALSRVFERAYEAVLNCADPADGRLRSDLFIELPSKREYPQYYTVIRRPIAMSQIRKRMRSAYYLSVADFRADFEQMFTNACTFNEEGSWVYVDAQEMKRVMEQALEAMCPAATGGEPAELLEWKAGTATNATATAVGPSTPTSSVTTPALTKVASLPTHLDGASEAGTPRTTTGLPEGGDDGSQGSETPTATATSPGKGGDAADPSSQRDGPMTLSVNHLLN
ncbi:ATP-dependent DNA helicase Snf21 [Tieghemiomyces parasiticus]|uniref:ATP-dependent DNA helicase Snf21 n=1 Tax=Tieghemiomyces parasiticus TaxID=78921 RepID=A0A9W8A680_9FUNG|nr:ATP-dependent DNA helicase Snf21 [Tieghemiomyces parasiticus]